MVEYIKKRAPEKVRFHFNTHGESVINARVSVSIFDWVIENLLKNALDAMEGKGDITIDIRQSAKDTIIDISDTGKGIPHGHLERVFKPGYTTKKRGWGLGLSLSRRIIEQYHQGRLTVESSEAGKGTTFRIVLKN
jgi:signal transduction histidine kinase